MPFRSGGAFTSSKVPDAQAVDESAITMQPAMLGGANFILHSAGWLEGGLAMGYEKFVLDNDSRGCALTRSPRAWTSRRTARRSTDHRGRSGPALLRGAAHTGHFESAFYRSNVADNNSFEQWDLEGGLDAAQRANGIWKRMLAEYEAPPIDEAADEALREWIERRKASFPDSNV